MVKRKTSLSLSDEAMQMRDEMAEELGVSGAAVVEMALREFVRAKRAERDKLARRPQDSPLPPTQVQTMPLGPTTMTAPPSLSYENDEPAPLEPSVAAFVGRVKPQARVFKPQPKKGKG